MLKLVPTYQVPKEIYELLLEAEDALREQLSEITPESLRSPARDRVRKAYAAISFFMPMIGVANE